MYNGPAYKVVEHVFYEFDIMGCSSEPEVACDGDDGINFTDIPQLTPAQLARAVRGMEGRKVLSTLREAGRLAREAFWAAVKPVTLTDAFKQWFTGSKAATEDGIPKVLYHAIASGCGGLYSSDGPVGREYGGDFGRGFYLYVSPETALTYGIPAVKVNEESGPSVIAAYLRVVNPLLLRTGKDLDALWARAGGKEAWLAKTPEEKAAYVQGLGFDSVLAHRWGQWVVYQPSQIKAAIDDDGVVAQHPTRSWPIF